MEDIVTFLRTYISFSDVFRGLGHTTGSWFMGNCLLENGYKFIVITDDAGGHVLIWGKVNDHTMLHVIATLGAESVQLNDWLTDFSDDSLRNWRIDYHLHMRMVAAGFAMLNGRITNWGSIGFGFVTPETIRPQVQAELLEAIVEQNAHSRQTAKGT